MWHPFTRFVAFVTVLLLTTQTFGEKDLSDDTEETQPIVEIMLGKTPPLSFLFWSGHGVVLAHVTLEKTSDPEKLRAKIVHFDRLVKSDKSASYEHRTSPEFDVVPFDDENGVRWRMADGKTGEVGETFPIGVKRLRKMSSDVPRYRPDGRAWWERFGATNAATATEAAIEVTKLSAELAKDEDEDSP